MHRAAAFGTAEDIAALVKVGSSVTLGTHLDLTPIRCAIRFENVDTFLELVKHLQPSFIDEQDIRGWALLHEAASMGSSKMLGIVLKHNADPHVMSRNTAYMVPSGLENRHVTPADVARREGEDAYLTYIQALKLAGFDVTVMQELEDGIDNIFWPAESGG
jgi:ankyrin repeat protein